MLIDTEVGLSVGYNVIVSFSELRYQKTKNCQILYRNLYRHALETVVRHTSIIHAQHANMIIHEYWSRIVHMFSP